MFHPLSPSSDKVHFSQNFQNHFEAWNTILSALFYYQKFGFNWKLTIENFTATNTSQGSKGKGEGGGGLGTKPAGPNL